jgi:lyso-ornithine lipid O-acyltransferase
VPPGAGYRSRVMQAVARDPIEALQPRRRSPLRFRAALPGDTFADIFGERPQGGRLRAIRRTVLLLLWTLVAIPVQAVLVCLPGRGKFGFPRVYHAMLCRLLGLEVRVVGRPATEAPEGRPVLFLSNHSSWLDILVLGSVLEACFVSKGEVGTWPLIGTVARLGRTVFVSRSRGATGREADAMRRRLNAGDSLVLFPEGTSNDGTRVLPFRSSFLATADAARQVQPVSLVYDRLGGLPACRRDRPLFAWYGDMEIGSHFWRLARRSGTRATVLLHEPFSPAALPDRKALAAEAGRIVSAGAAGLRQNRPIGPLPGPAALPENRPRLKRPG